MSVVPSRMLSRNVPGIVLIIAAGFAAAETATNAFESFLEGPESIWERPRDAWLTGPTASWFRGAVDAPDDDLRYPGYRNSPGLAFLDYRVYELVLHYRAGALTSATLSLYNRGDAGELPQAEFLDRVRAVDAALSARFEQRATPQPNRNLSGGVRVMSRAWRTKEFLAELIWSSSRHAVTGTTPTLGETEETKGFRAEYIQIRLSPLTARRALGGGTAPSSISSSASSIRRNVKRDETGFVFVDGVPMVDQGQRGYCAVATAERLLRYYGRNVDQHVLAQMADTFTGGGTSPEVMFDVLRKTGMKFGVKAKVYEELTPKSMLSLVEKYNAAAKRADKPEIEAAREGVINVDQIYAAMDPETLRQARCERDATGFRGFSADIARSVDQGIPLAWGVMLGVVKEADLPQTRGGHMRIIFGYNKQTQALLYSDSWGLGHARKVMSMADAWTITTGLYALDPRY